MRLQLLRFCLAVSALLNFSLGLTAEGKVQESAKIEILPTVGHFDAVYSVAFSPDGARALSGSFDHTLKLWDVRTGSLLRTFEGHTDWVQSVAFSPDGREVLSGSKDKTIKLWNAATGQVERAFSGHTEGVSSVAFSPDGTQVLSGAADTTLRLWDASTGENIRTFQGQLGPIRAVAFSHDGSRLLSGSEDGSVKVWDAASGKLLNTFQALASDSIYTVAFSPDNSRILAGDQGGVIYVWDVMTGRLLFKFWGRTSADRAPFTTFVSSVDFSPDGSRILSGGADGTLKVWEATTGNLLQQFEGHSQWVHSVKYSPDGTRILSGSKDGTVKLWDATTGQLLHTLQGAPGWVGAVSLSPNGVYVLSGGRDGTLNLWEAATGRLLRRFVGHDRSVHSVAFSPDGRRLLSAAGGEMFPNATLKLWDVETGELLRTFESHSDRTGLFAPNGAFVLSANQDGKLSKWNTDSGKLLRAFPEYSDLTDAFLHDKTSLAIASDGSRAVSGGSQLQLWDLETGRLLRTFKGLGNWKVLSVAFSPDGTRVLSSGADNTVKLWDVTTGQLLLNFEGHTAPVNSVAFSPDGSGALSGSTDGTIRLWDAGTGKLLRSFEGHRGSVNSVAFAASGKRVLSGGDDGSIKIWNAASGQLLVSLFARSDGEWLAMTPAGFFAASRGEADVVHVVRGQRLTLVAQIYDHLYRPDLVGEQLKGDPDGKYVDAASKVNLQTILDSGPAPEIEFLERRTEQSADTVRLSVRIKDAGGGIGSKVVWRVNGKTRGDLTTAGLRGAPDPGRTVVMTQRLEVDPGQSNTMEITAYNGADLLASLPLTITGDPFGVTRQERPRLHVLAIGVEKYAIKDYELHYAVKDAKDFGDALKTVGSSLFSEVKVTPLYDTEVTKDGIDAAINKLAGEVKPTDVFVLFLGGQGRSIAGKYYFLQQDLDFEKGQSIERDGIGQDLWQAWLAKIPAQKTLLVFDTCESAAAAGLVRGGERERQTAMEQFEHATGQNLIAAARQATLEGYEGHGVLTYAILSAFAKPANGNTNDRVDVDGLAAYVGEQVPEITKSLYGIAQEPIRELSGNNFPLGLRVMESTQPSDCPDKQEFVVIRNQRVREKPDGQSAGDRILDPGYAVAAKFVGSWVLLCRDGVKLGYVPPEAVLRTK
jgi:WD40 repeat protein